MSTILVILAALALAVSAQVQVNTPPSVQSCLPVQLTWSGGKGPYYLGLIAAGQPGSPILKDFGTQNGNSYVWNVDAPSGSSYTIQIRDGDGQLNYSDKFTVQPSSQTCTTSGGSTSGGSGSPSSPPASGGGGSSQPGNNSTSGSSTNTTGKGSTAGPATSPGGTAKPTTNPPPSNTATITPPANSTQAGASTSDSVRVRSGISLVAVAVAASIFA